MERRTFLLGLVGGLAAAAGLAATGSTPAEALPLKPTPTPGGAAEDAADIKPEDLDGVRTEDAQYYIVRRRRYRPWRRRYYYRPRYIYRPRRRYWRRRYYW
jgi:hypothetical protein